MSDLRGFLAELEADPKEGILRIEREVDPDYELTAVVKALESRGNPVVLFERVKGSDFPVLFGVTGTKERIARALGQTPDSCVEWLLGRLEEPVAPVRIDEAPVQEVVRLGDEARLDLLPIGTHSPDDAGPYITSGVTFVRDQATGNQNSGMYRTMIKGPRAFTLNASLPHDLAKVMEWGAAHGEPVEFAVVFGGHPAVAIASQAKNAMTLDVNAVAGALLGRPLEVVRGKTVDLDVPAQAEIVIEGRVLPGVREPEGPFGEFTYYYGAANGWMCEITAITHRRDAIYVDIHPAHTEHRCLWLFPGREARLLSFLRLAIPTVKAVHIPLYGGSMSAYISMAKMHDGDARKALMLALSSDNYIKHAFVFDEDVDIFDAEHVLWALNVRLQGDTDMVVVPNCRGIRMDPSAYSLLDRSTTGALTTKLGFDVTMPLERPYGPRADRVPDGFEDLDVASYLPTAGLPGSMA
jgi:2,5-furandicarboxylate decarboxylase 1